MSYVCYLICEYIAYPEGTPGELKHLSTRRKERKIRVPLVAASETGSAQTNKLKLVGVAVHLYTGVTKDDIRRIIWKDESKKVIIL